MKAQEQFDKETERKHLEKTMQRKVLGRKCKLQEEFEVVKFRLEEETHQHDFEGLHARSLLE